MPYGSFGNRARKTGNSCRKMATACLRACETAKRSEGARIGISWATDSSSAKMRDAVSTKARARRRGFSCAVARYASTMTLMSTSSALGCGRSAELGCILKHPGSPPNGQSAPKSFTVATRNGGYRIASPSECRAADQSLPLVAEA